MESMKVSDWIRIAKFPYPYNTGLYKTHAVLCSKIAVVHAIGYKYMRFRLFFGKFSVFCCTSGVLSQFWRNFFTVISGKLTVTNYLKQNDFDYSNSFNSIK